MSSNYLNIGWIGVDLDGTLAHYDSWNGIEHIGEPIVPMLEYVKSLVAKNIEVRIFTARVTCDWKEEDILVIRIIQDWLEKHGLPRLAVTNAKDFQMRFLIDDRAVAVETNTGKPVLGALPYL